ncbi:PaaI family thioesterase [Rhodococcus sp. NPDC003322]
MEDALTRMTPADASPILNQGFCEAIGLEYLEVTGDRVCARWEVGPHLFQPAGIVNGGVHCTVIETLSSIGGSVWLGDRGHVVGVNNNTDFLRASRNGTLTATATPVHRGRTQQLWQVQIVDEQERLVARGQVRLANIEDTGRLANG